MRYNVAGLLRAPTGETREFDVVGVVRVEDAHTEVISPVRGRVVLVREPDGILVEARLSTDVAMQCIRCLTSLESVLEFDIEESFRPTVHLPGGPTVVAADDDDTATHIDELHTLDLTEVVRQAILLEMPVSPLCREDCPGLCPTCGHDLREGECKCEPEPDPRWDALRDILLEQ
jgi:uncharacterized protein